MATSVSAEAFIRKLTGVLERHLMQVEHEFEFEDGNEVSPANLDEAPTYEVLATYMDVDREEDKIVFTHRIRIWPKWFEVAQAVEGLGPEGGENGSG